ncbi:hypothetical protein KAH37_06290 [bacterium]|nr:hypothetical protein [bacterium]
MAKEIVKSNTNEQQLFTELAVLIEQSKNQVVAQVNSILTLTYWQVGKKINDNILHNKRAEYGKQIVTPLATQLVERYGNSFNEKNLRRMMQFSEEFPDFETVVPLARQLRKTIKIKAQRILLNDLL